ncbi:5'-methylthioadenosine phosphorylase [Cryobacterium frigoriphilum]|uniref:S-methyl-5'-thioadenosine phosphorylase n=1 Tax=Cryobacterium frigoriphilum TaxID=1259150 RepID=A0A4R9A296_9MICO|nr:MTAP family purine nucleoside phosphorylase [Cryobacterium frigoriphilum]TFD50819.1 5'-methylthioadenosine phosphorylase [Cryobacterium frigoriphilum]
MTPSDLAQIAVIGGSGLYQLFAPEQSTVHEIATPYGSASVTVGQRAGRRVAFLPRHGTGHSVAPHLINYRANIWALASLGVKAIISSAAVGGVNPEYPPGLLVVTDQFIDRTSGRPDTFYEHGSVQHLSAADPFDPVLRRVAIDALEALDEQFAATGTVVIIQGPRFSTRAESVWFRAVGADIVNMTQYPEVVLASELNMSTVNLSFVTDADAGLSPREAEPGAANAEATPATDAVTADLVFRRLAEAQPRILAAIDGILRALPRDFAPRALIAPAEVRAVLEREVQHHPAFELPPLNPPAAAAAAHGSAPAATNTTAASTGPAADAR